MIELPDRKTILDTVHNSVDYHKTEKLVSHLGLFKKERPDFFLTSADLEKILDWKLRDQIGRQRKIREKNTDEIVEKITKTAFAIVHPNNEIETEFKISILTTLKGVGIPVASSILTLSYPNKYAVIDFRNWRQLYGVKKNSYSLKEYLKYLKDVKEMAKSKNVNPQDIDIYLWVKDRRTD